MWYLLVGKESFLKREFTEDLRQRLFPKDAHSNLNFQTFTAKKEPLGAVFDFLQTAPFLAEKRLAILNPVELLPEEQRSLLLEFLDQKISTADLVMESNEASVKKSSFLMALSKKSQLVNCYPPFDKDLPRWIATRSRKYGKPIEEDAVDVLIERAGKDLATLDLALQQLALFCRTQPKIRTEEAEQLLGKSVQGDIFKLMDWLLSGDIRSSMELLTTLFKDGNKSYEMMGALVSQFERLRRAAVLLREGVSQERVAAELKIHSFYLEKTIQQARNLSDSKIDFMLNELLRCDEAIKTGGLGEERAMERLVLQLCVGGKN